MFQAECLKMQIMVNIMKYLIECMDENGNWNKFNYFEGNLSDMRHKMGNIIIKTNYLGIRCTKV